MRLATPTGAAQHLSYCTNIHPAETLGEVRAALARYVPAVKTSVAPDAEFGVGLRLSARAARELMAAGALSELRSFLSAQGLYVFTLNGFPYGAFHGQRVKQRVYEPDWRSAERVEYTRQLAVALAGLLPAGTPGSISSVPGGWRAAVSGKADLDSMADHMLQSAAQLFEIGERSGCELALALEPEPGCVLETIAQAVEFFETRLFSERAVRRLAELSGASTGRAAELLRVHIGLCLDTCHAAVEFEDPPELLSQLARAGIGVKKLQLSSGLRVPHVDAAAKAALAAFAEDVYLHQTVERRAGELHRYDDLPDALSATPDDGRSEWRVHFHVPVFLESYGILQSTQGFLREILQLQAAEPISSHLEVETYTWDVLPAPLRGSDVTAAISRELEFVLREVSR
ncbi:MAG TPA: metabolite traffic protein EboE [Polyangiales bacterium]|nr:metabolite traffic protein EboE [Polyangiales bacterium]